jgi:hypothetical protein
MSKISVSNSMIPWMGRKHKADEDVEKLNREFRRFADGPGDPDSESEPDERRAGICFRRVATVGCE